MNDAFRARSTEKGLQDLQDIIAQGGADLAKEALASLGERHDLGPGLRGASPDQLGERTAALAAALRAAGRGETAALLLLMRQLGDLASRNGGSLASWCSATSCWSSLLSGRLVREHARDPGRLSAALEALGSVLGLANAAIGDAQSASQERLLRETRERTAQALQASERRFFRIFESGIISVLVCDLVGNIKDANDAFLNMVGYTRDELTSGKVRWVEMTPPEWLHLDAEAVEQLKARGVTRTWEKEYLRKDGSRVPILVGVAMLNDVECIAFVVDITERKRLEQMRNRAQDLEAENRRIQESNRLKSEFLANMSHELRTPLNSIIGFADLLHDGEIDPTSPQHKEFLGDILRSGRHLLQIINDVLDLAKVEAGKIEFHPEVLDLQQVSAETSAVLRTVAAAKKIDMQIDIDPTVKEVTVDGARLKQVLYNYASNALKFTPDGGRVVIRARPEGEDAFRLEVEDNGIGIAAADRSRLFIEFQQLDAGTAKRHQGTGLGLALTKRIVEAQGGSVGVNSTPGRGSVFYAVLPRQANGEEDPPPPPLEPVIADDRAPVILVVEDDTRDKRVLQQILGKGGYRIEAVATGNEAIAACRQRTYDAITLDLLLPDLTGLEVLHRIRSEGKNTVTPVVVVSMVGQPTFVSGYTVHDFLRKPIDGGELIASLQRAGVAPADNDTILVIDDDPNALKLMSATLQKLGYRVETSQNAGSALDDRTGRPPAAVIVDLLMPGVDGFEFLARFRSRPENGKVPVVVWTMKDLSRDDVEKLQQLAQAVVAKGEGKTSSLIDLLRGLLGQPQPARLEAGA